MIRWLLLVLATVACTSDSERSRAAADWRAARDSVLSGSVVQAMRSPAAPGRIIYDRPTDLSYDSLRVNRPDLIPAADRLRR